VQTNPVARVIMLVTFGATLVLPLQYAVFLGVVFAILLFVFQQSNTIRVVEWVVQEAVVGRSNNLPPGSLNPKRLRCCLFTVICSMRGANFGEQPAGCRKRQSSGRDPALAWL